MILRGQYMTLQAEQKQALNEINAFGRTIKSLDMTLNGYYSHEPHRKLGERLQESLTAIQRLIELDKKVSMLQSEIDRIKPMTGL